MQQLKFLRRPPIMIDRINVELDAELSEACHDGEILPHGCPDFLVITEV